MTLTHRAEKKFPIWRALLPWGTLCLLFYFFLRHSWICILVPTPISCVALVGQNTEPFIGLCLLIRKMGIIISLLHILSIKTKRAHNVHRLAEGLRIVDFNKW